MGFDAKRIGGSGDTDVIVRWKDDAELIEIARMSCSLGLSLQEIALIFQVPDGFSRLEELIAARQREMDIITYVVSMFEKE